MTRGNKETLNRDYYAACDSFTVNVSRLTSNWLEFPFVGSTSVNSFSISARLFTASLDATSSLHLLIK